MQLHPVSSGHSSLPSALPPLSFLPALPLSSASSTAFPSPSTSDASPSTFAVSVDPVSSRSTDSPSATAVGHAHLPSASTTASSPTSASSSLSVSSTLHAPRGSFHRTSIAQYIDAERRHAQEQQYHLHKKRQHQLHTADASSLQSLSVVYLPRGGIYVHTPAGPIQFGLPPETIKDSMRLGLTLPSYFIIPKERFNLVAGINVAEFEFPAYYNFFFKRRRINLICTRQVEPLIRTIFTETLLGPSSVEWPAEYGSNCSKRAYPDLAKEMSYFRVNPFDRTPLTVDTLLAFTHFDEQGRVHLDHGVCIADVGEEYVVTARVQQEGQEDSVVKEIARLRQEVFSIPVMDETQTQTQTQVQELGAEGRPMSAADYFVPPHFGVTMLGNSDGFDSAGTTTGFVLWMNRRGIMVDPPPHSGALLKRHGISARLMRGVILTHWSNPHSLRTPTLIPLPPARHSFTDVPSPVLSVLCAVMRTTMQAHSKRYSKRGRYSSNRHPSHQPPDRTRHHPLQPLCSLCPLRAVRPSSLLCAVVLCQVVLMTTEVILDSFLRKYSAISGLDAAFLRKLFVFRPVLAGQRTAVYGGHVEFFYSLHSIPCVGFAAYCGGKSMVYSGDSFNDPAGIQRLYEQGYVSEGRRDALINFPWHHDLILHEAGVPPIHTPLATLEALPADVKQRLFIVHKPSKDVPMERGLQSALVGPAHTLVISSHPPANASALEVLDLLSSIDMFSGFDLSRALEMLQCATFLSFHRGDTLIHEGTFGSTLYVIAMGTVRVSQEGAVIKELTVGDHFGEMSIVTGEKRTASIHAVTPVEVIQFSKDEFLYIVRHTDAIQRLQQLGVIQRSPSWQAISANSSLSQLSSAQKTYLQSLFIHRIVRAGEVIWQAGETATEAVLIADGQFYFSRAKEQAPFTRGALVGDMKALIAQSTLSTTLLCQVEGSVYAITRVHLLKFFDDNPGVKITFMNRRFIE